MYNVVWTWPVWCVACLIIMQVSAYVCVCLRVSACVCVCLRVSACVNSYKDTLIETSEGTSEKYAVVRSFIWVSINPDPSTRIANGAMWETLVSEWSWKSDSCFAARWRGRGGEEVNTFQMSSALLAETEEGEKKPRWKRGRREGMFLPIHSLTIYPPGDT